VSDGLRLINSTGSALTRDFCVYREALASLDRWFAHDGANRLVNNYSIGLVVKLIVLTESV
jgi:hypothetical protein